MYRGRARNAPQIVRRHSSCDPEYRPKKRRTSASDRMTWPVVPEVPSDARLKSCQTQEPRSRKFASSACTFVGRLRVNVNNDLHSPATISNCAMRVVGGLERELLRIHDGYHLAGTREQGGFAQNLPVMFSTNTGE